MKCDVVAGVHSSTIFVLLYMKIASNLEWICHTSCAMYSNKKNSNENLKICFFNSANHRLAVASIVWEIPGAFECCVSAQCSYAAGDTEDQKMKSFVLPLALKCHEVSSSSQHR